MPIKSCTRCGLKVLVDASQAASDTYLCPRCVSESKGSAAAPKPAASGKRSSVKVLCPYCGASFSGSIPSRPAKGGCPVCQKELVLLPDGTIQAAASFNLSAWQKQREAKKAEPTPPAPAPEEAMPAAADPIGGSTILDMGGPPPAAASMPTLEEGPMEFPGGLGGETMLGMGGQGAPPAPRPSIDEPTPPPSPPPEEPVRSYGEPEPPPADDLGGETILDSDGPRAVELPEPSLDEKLPDQDLLRETMPGMDRPPAAETPVPAPTPPPVPEEEPAPALESEEAAEPADRESDYSRPEEPEPPAPSMDEEPAGEPAEASMESSPELPDNLGGSTMLGIGGSDDMAPPRPEPIPTIEEPPPEAVPILAKDVAPIELPPPDEPAAAEPPAEAPSPEPAEAKPYVYGPIARVPRKIPGSMGPPPPPATVPRAPVHSGPLPPPPAPSTSSQPVLGSDFRIATAPPPPKAPLSEATKAAGVKTSQVATPPARPNMFRVVLAWILLLLPLAAGFLLYSMQKTSAVGKIIQKLSDEVTPGFRKMDEEIKKAIAKPAESPVETPDKK